MDERRAKDGICTTCGDSLHGDPYQHDLCYDCREAFKLPDHGKGKEAYLKCRGEGWTQREAAVLAGISRWAGQQAEKKLKADRLLAPSHVRT